MQQAEFQKLTALGPGLAPGGGGHGSPAAIIPNGWVAIVVPVTSPRS